MKTDLLLSCDLVIVRSYSQSLLLTFSLSLTLDFSADDRGVPALLRIVVVLLLQLLLQTWSFSHKVDLSVHGGRRPVPLRFVVVPVLLTISAPDSSKLLQTWTLSDDRL